MKHSFTHTVQEKKTAYYWHTDHDWNYLELATELIPAEPAYYSLESFTRDHYYAYSRQNAVKTREFKIEHPPWQIYPGI